MKAFYYSFGQPDVFGIASLPDNISATAFALITCAAGMAEVRTTVLITPKEVDEATKKKVDYRPSRQ